MASENSATIPQDPTKVTDEAGDKGKGKAVAAEEPVDQSMDEDDDEDSGDEEAGDDAADDDDNMDEIDLNNIVDGGRRTRGRVIDWAKAAEENPADDDDDDDDEDDFQPEGEGDADKMDED
ncbi:histone chaperone domain CHZ-domain-containing protein [Xylaria bambusicola]|uniref:histone chaperone domain CHZ-domain-containing protein n=1 Tax=Xylaria bambusicola TaxID=326684 RepID=UPI002007504E|nr:histone chaperone domain CHZ-domain-containing protein [Xylaria bambusicola]KAI0518432.1 histone chaperone domain CHZ-domain-containing protein [Xylaria bambusicola]